MRILVAEDDPGLRSVLERGLREGGYVVDSVADGEAALVWLRGYDYAVAIVDWRMPKRSGIEVVEEARRQGIRTPILMLTARDTPADRVTGLRTGADDYLVKPFDFEELTARLAALQRRPAQLLAPRLEVGDLRFDPSTREVTVQTRPVALTTIETGIVELLLRRHPALVTRQSIAVQVWEDESDAAGSNTIDVHVGRLRAKLAGSSARILTVRGSGYRLVGP
jgi:two-component system copper resistance phosphate regulon response regulator CusR